MNNPVNNSHIDEIANWIIKNECVFFIGSEFSTIESGISTTELKEHFVSHTGSLHGMSGGEIQEMSQMNTLLEIAQYGFNKKYNSKSEKRIQSYRQALENEFFLKKQRHVFERIPSTAHLLLTSLGIQNIVTSNYDHMIEDQYKEIGFGDVNIISGKHDEHKTDQNSMPNVYKLFGTLKGNNLIILEQQLENLFNENGLATFLKKFSDKHFVFIGYTSADIYIRKIYDHMNSSDSPLSFCVMSEEQNAKLLWEGRPIHVIPMGILNFLYQLRLALLLRNVTRESDLWSSYFLRLHEDLKSTYKDYFIPLKSKEGNEIRMKQDENEKILLLGGSGTGKSTFVKMEILRALAIGKKIPVFIDFKTSSDSVSDFDVADVYNFILKRLSSYGIHLTEQDEELIRMKLRNGGFFFAFDGLDLIKLDVHAYETIIGKINGFLHEDSCRQCMFLVSSREEYYKKMRENKPLDIHNEIHLPYLSDEQVKNYLFKRNMQGLLAVMSGYRNINFFLMEILCDIPERLYQTVQPGNTSALYEVYFKGKVQHPEDFEILARLAYDILFNEYTRKNIDSHPVYKDKVSSLTSANLLEVDRDSSQYKFKHDSVGEFFSAWKILNDSSSKEQKESDIDKCFQEAKLRPILVFMTGLVDKNDSDKIITRLLSKEWIEETISLAIRCVGNAKNISIGPVLQLFIEFNLHYKEENQIATPIVARKMGALGKNGENALKVFLEADYKDTLKEALEYLDEFSGGEKLATLFHDKKAYQSVVGGMLRRSAIACLGAIKTKGANTALTEALEKFEQLAEQAGNDDEKNEWLHNEWHVCIALGENVGFERGGDGIVRGESLGSRLRTAQDEAEKETIRPEAKSILRELLGLIDSGQEGFKWRRAHAIEVYGRLAELDEELHREIVTQYKEAIERAAETDDAFMVKYYACQVIGGLREPVFLKVLLRLINDEKSWVKYAALSSVENIVTNPKSQNQLAEYMHNLHTSLYGFLEGSYNKFSKMNKVDQSCCAVALRIAGKILAREKGKDAVKKSIEIIEKFTVFDTDALLEDDNIQRIAGATLEMLKRDQNDSRH